MSKINYQALREAAEKATWGDWDSYKPHRGARGYEVRLSSQAIAQHVLKNNAEFIAAFNPKVALALLDEREKNQQYIKRPDQENEDIALTVGKLSVELEASENNLIDSECHVAELEEALRDKQALLEASEKRIAELRDWNAGLAQESLTYQQRVAELEVIKSAAEKLVRCKGRYHSEQNYRALAALFGVTVPDLPPLEAESVSQTYKLNELSGNSPVSPGGWISCSERMPNDKQYVWCWGKSYGWTEYDTFEGYYDWSRNKWWAVTDDGEEPASKVTHWMPLPEPPQEVNRG